MNRDKPFVVPCFYDTGDSKRSMEGKEAYPGDPGVLSVKPCCPFASELMIEVLSARRLPRTVPEASTAWYTEFQ
jgi:hypothetical protein